jgi:hypothetical protein
MFVERCFYVDWTMEPHLLVGRVIKSFSGICCIAYSQEVLFGTLLYKYCKAIFCKRRFLHLINSSLISMLGIINWRIFRIRDVICPASNRMSIRLIQGRKDIEILGWRTISCFKLFTYFVKYTSCPANGNKILMNPKCGLAFEPAETLLWDVWFAVIGDWMRLGRLPIQRL